MRKKDITKEIARDDEFLKIVAPILGSNEFKKRNRTFKRNSKS